MPLDKLTAFTKKVADLADKPNATMSAAEVKAQFDAAPEELRVAFNQLIDDLSSVADGGSGADNISATPIATSPATVQGILEWLKTQIDSTVLGQIPDASIPPEKLSFTIETPSGSQDKVDTHANNANNPHAVTASQTGAVPTTDKGQPNGVPSLDASGLIPSSQIPVVSGSWQTLSTLTLSGDIGQVDFIVDPNYKEFDISFSALGSTVASNLWLRFNDISTSIYEYQYHRINSAIATPGNGPGGSIILCDANILTTVADLVGAFRINNTSNHKYVVFNALKYSSNFASAQGTFKSSANISKISLVNPSGLFKAGATFTVRGLK